MMNPIRKARGEMNRVQFARLINVSYSSVAQAESGYPRSLSTDLVKALEGIGVDIAAIEAEYSDWRRSATAEKV